MGQKEYRLLEMLAYEAFIRRASEIGMPFMLKGSYVTRQYFPDHLKRIPADLDWLYLDKLTDKTVAEATFDEWAIRVTESDTEDEVKFTSFKENRFWRYIDYAMADDFPTVNTDLECEVEGEKLGFSLDISFNLDVEDPPVPLLYKPLTGNPFLVPYTAPISLQVAWKIHQTLVRPRFKDLLDLTYLVQHPSFNGNTLRICLQALINECSADHVHPDKLRYFMFFETGSLFTEDPIEETWDLWRHNINKRKWPIMYHDKAPDLVDKVSEIPQNLSVFLLQFRSAMQKAGFGFHLLDKLPAPTRTTRTSMEE